MRKSGWAKLSFFQDWSEIVTFSAAAEKKSEKQWQIMKKKLESASESEWKLAVTEAEDLLDEALRRSGFTGDTFGEIVQHIKSEQLN